jgi:putative hydrolase of HD superfamily
VKQVFKEIEQVLDFMIEIEKLKGVLRKTKPLGLDRYENSAEHSWHVCLAALMLKDYANNTVDIDKVIKMLLIHDLGEIDAGDTIIYASETKENKAKERAGMARILALLPEGRAGAYLRLWDEFEAGETAESQFARAVDRVPPLLYNLNSEGASWKQNQVSSEMVFKVNQRIGEGSQSLWSVISQKLNDAMEKGFLK